MRLFRLAFTLAFIVVGLLPAQQQFLSSHLRSPDARLDITFETVQNGQPSQQGQIVYSLSFKGNPLIDRSALRLELQGMRPLGTDVRILSATPSQHDETYSLVTGKAKQSRDHFNALRIDLQETVGPRRKFAVEARVYDDAVAFRYVIPDQPGLREYLLTKEVTEFRLSKDAITYALMLPNFRSSYESEYIKLNASAFAGKSGLSTTLIGCPLLMNIPGAGWMAITEADLHDNSSMYLVNPGTGWGSHMFESRLAPGDDPEVLVKASLPHHSAWRVFLVGDQPGQLIESNAILNLNPSSAVADTSWIHAGLVSWDWWSGSLDKAGHPAFTTDNMKSYVDFAANSAFPYMLVDAGWAAQNDITKMNGTVDIPELVRYAAPKKVKIWIWMHYKDVDAQMNEAFPLFEKWGVAGLKIDFVERDDQKGIDFYYRAAALAAEHHLMVDFHGATKPTGMERTYPNVLGYEAVLGMEQSKAGARDNPDHRATLPFTRMLAGPMDYTPGGFENVTRDAFVSRSTRPMVMGTRAQQLALYAIYLAPFQMVSDSPAAYTDQPAFDFIKHSPATWDQTKVLNGVPGEYITVARRSGADWFLGAITNWNPRTLELPLDFLGPGKYTAEIYADAEDADRYPKNVRVTKQAVTAATRLKVNLAPGGGYAVRFVPVH